MQTEGNVCTVRSNAGIRDRLCVHTLQRGRMNGFPTFSHLQSFAILQPSGR
jgi:hypothetical protein